MELIEEVKIRALRNSLVKQINELEKDKLMLITQKKEVIDKLLFNTDKRGAKTFALSKKYLDRINFSNVSFDNFNARNYNFTGLHNVEVDPQTVFDRDLSYSILSDVEFIGPFDDVKLVGANFKDSFGGLLDPQMVYNKDLTGVNLSSLYIIDDFDGVTTSFGKKNDEDNYEEIILINRSQLPNIIHSLIESGVKINPGVKK